MTVELFFIAIAWVLLDSSTALRFAQNDGWIVFHCDSVGIARFFDCAQNDTGEISTFGGAFDSWGNHLLARI